MLFRYFLPAIQLFFAISVCAQADETSNGHELSFSSGAVHARMTDRAFSHNSLRFSGTAFTPALAYQRKWRDSQLFRAALQGSKGTVRSRHLPADAELYQFHLTLSWAHLLHTYAVFGQESRLYLGAQAAANDFMLVELEVIEDGAATFYYSAGLYLQQRTHLGGRNELYADLFLPLAGFVKRASYDGGINQKMESDLLENQWALFFSQSRFSLIPPHHFPQLRLSYKRRFAAGASYAVHYQFLYLRNDDIAPVRMYSNSLLFGLNFHF